MIKLTCRDGVDSNIRLMLVFFKFHSQSDENVDATLLKSTSPSALLCGENIFDLDLIYIVSEKIIVYDFSKDNKLVEGVLILLCSYYVFNFDYTIQKNLLLFLEAAWLATKVSFIKLHLYRIM